MDNNKLKQWFEEDKPNKLKANTDFRNLIKSNPLQDILKIKQEESIDFSG